jgi:hypothetical protein
LLAGLLVLDDVVLANRKLWQAYDPDDHLERVQGCQRRRHDLVFIGGSPVAEGIDPALLEGVSWHGRPLGGAYNLGLPGGTTSEFWHAVRHGITTPTRLVVYGITASDVNDSRDEPHDPHSLMDAHDVLHWVQARPSAAEWCVRHFVQGQITKVWKLYQYRNGIRLWAADQVEQLRPGTFTDAVIEAREGRRYSAALKRADGYAPRPSVQAGRLDQLKAAGAVNWRFDFLQNFRLGGHLGYLHRLLDWANHHGVDMVLVDMPVSADLEERLWPEAFARYRQALAEVERSRGVLVLRGSRAAVGLTDADFADLVHLNASGTARLGSWLRRQLEKAGSPTQGGSR